MFHNDNNQDSTTASEQKQYVANFAGIMIHCQNEYSCQLLSLVPELYLNNEVFLMFVKFVFLAYTYVIYYSIL